MTKQLKCIELEEGSFIKISSNYMETKLSDAKTFPWT